jgi:predicted GTPase
VSKAKFKITPERVRDTCNLVEYINLTVKDFRTVTIVSPRFITKPDGEYYMTFTYDEDGDIKTSEGYTEALRAMSDVTLKRLEKLTHEFSEAAKGIVNPPNGTG